MAKPDWAAIEIDYRAGQLSNRAIAEKHGVSDTAIRKKAKQAEWEKPAKSSHKEVRTANQTANLRTSANELIEDEELTPLQAAFVLEYIKDKNATRAAERAGYAEPQYGCQLLMKTNVLSAIKRQLKAMAERQLITADRILAELAAIGFSNFKDLVKENGSLASVSSMPREVSAAIREVRVKTISGGDNGDIDETTYKLHDKRAALSDLAKHLNLLSPTSESENTEPTPVKINVNVIDARKYGDQSES